MAKSDGARRRWKRQAAEPLVALESPTSVQVQALPRGSLAFLLVHEGRVLVLNPLSWVILQKDFIKLELYLAALLEHRFIVSFFYSLREPQFLFEDLMSEVASLSIHTLKHVVVLLGGEPFGSRNELHERSVQLVEVGPYPQVDLEVVYLDGTDRVSGLLLS